MAIGAIVASAAAAYLGSAKRSDDEVQKLNKVVPQLGDLPEEYAATMTTADWMKRDSAWREQADRMLRALAALRSSNAPAVAVRLYGAQAGVPTTSVLGFYRQGTQLKHPWFNITEPTMYVAEACDLSSNNATKVGRFFIRKQAQFDVKAPGAPFYIGLGFKLPLSNFSVTHYLLAGTAECYDPSTDVTANVGIGDLAHRAVLGPIVESANATYSSIVQNGHNATTPHIYNRPPNTALQAHNGNLQMVMTKLTDEVLDVAIRTGEYTFANPISNTVPRIVPLAFWGRNCILTKMTVNATGMISNTGNQTGDHGANVGATIDGKALRYVSEGVTRSASPLFLDAVKAVPVAS